MNKIKYEGIDACARIEISEDAANADQKVKWFLKFHKTRNFCGKHIFSFLLSQVSIQVQILQIFRFSPH